MPVHPEAAEPCYIRLYRSGELARRRQRAYSVLVSCTLCPRECRANRCSGERGFCRTGRNPVISSYGPHRGEEPPLVGTNGSGTIFVTHCTMACRFCQNFRISRCGEGQEITPDQLAGVMLSLQVRGCHNINIVSPTHIVPQLIHALEIACGNGLCIPLVYNTGGYDSVETLRLLDGIIDIYMPDAKYGDDRIAGDLSGIPGYTGVMRSALREMHRQVGDLVIEGGIARKGLIIRHLVLPENCAGSDGVLPWIAREISRDSYVNIMDQYHWPGLPMPEKFLSGHPEYGALTRSVSAREFARAIRWAEDAGLHRGFSSPGR